MTGLGLSGKLEIFSKMDEEESKLHLTNSSKWYW